MRFEVRLDLSYDEVLAALPSAYRKRASPRFPAGKYALMVFTTGDKDVVISSDVSKALVDIPSDTPIIAAAGSFTIEAIRLFKGRAAAILWLRDFIWTDDDYQRVNQAERSSQE